MKNIIQWKRGSSNMNHLDRVSLMRHDLDELKENERTLDALIDKMKENAKSQQDSKYAYVTCNDLHAVDMYKDQMLLAIKAPSESQLILLDGDLPPIILKSEREKIDVFFCPDPSSGSSGMHQAAPDTSDDDDFPSKEATASIRKTKSSSSSTLRKRNLGTAQRNLSKAFEAMSDSKRTGKSKTNLFHTFNTTVKREAATESDEDDNDNDETAALKKESSPTKDSMLLNDTNDDTEAFGIKKDVKLSLFSPQKILQASNIPDHKWGIDLSPNYLSHSDDRFFPLEPDAEYNFLLSESEGVMDLFDYKI